ncbi:MAG: YceI family protein, partial [Bacteroidia bacterium]|nr:YceI family protein [Bacteroidia bacterium]
MKSIKIRITLILIFAACNFVSAQIFSSSNANIGFYSETPLENIAAESNVGVILVNTKTGDIV